jgi:alpha-amylase/alpha-mannosidase (GH57 family)
MALAYALNVLDAHPEVQLTNYGEFLERHPPAWEARIHQKSAWSCAHGVERWNSHCGCNSGGRPKWNQHWRFPLRRALDWLRDELAPRYEEKARAYLADPWKARDEYIDVILDRHPDSVEGFLQRHRAREFGGEDRVHALRLLELQRHAMLMYTSCGWFFDEISGIETVQVLQYAARAIQIAHDLLDEDLEGPFLEKLADAKSNIREHRDGRHIYNKFVKPAIIGREQIGAHYAVSSLFESYPEQARIYSFTVDQESRELLSAGAARLAIGRVRVRFEITQNSDTLTYAVLHWGDHHINCGVRHYRGPEAFQETGRELREAFERADFPQILRLMDQHFGESTYSLKSLFRDEQRRVLDQILGSTRSDLNNTFRLVTDRYIPLLRFLADLSTPPPSELRMAVHSVFNAELRRQFDSDRMDFERVRSLLSECERDKIPFDAESLAYSLKSHLDKLSVAFRKSPDEPGLLEYLAEVALLARDIPFDVNLWKTQNLYNQMLHLVLPEKREEARSGDERAAAWAANFEALGERLGFEVNGR